MRRSSSGRHYASYELTDRELVGLIDAPPEEVEQLLWDAGAVRQPLAALKTLPDGRKEVGSWAFRDGLLAETQTHVILFDGDPRGRDVGGGSPGGLSHQPLDRPGPLPRAWVRCRGWRARCSRAARRGCVGRWVVERVWGQNYRNPQSVNKYGQADVHHSRWGRTRWVFWDGRRNRDGESDELGDQFPDAHRDGGANRNRDSESNT